MKEISESIEIDAPPRKVWPVLVHLRRHPEWNPVVSQARGVPLIGSRLKARLGAPDGRGVRLRAKVTRYESGRTFRWVGHLGVPGLFGVEHTHEVEPLPAGRTRHVVRQRFRGALVPLMGRVVDEARPSMMEANVNLKARVEDAQGDDVARTAA